MHNTETGILNYNYDGTTRAVCDDLFDASTAAVACFELYQNDTVISYSQGNTCDYADFWLDDILCESDDYTLGDCQHFPYGNHNC